jgi:hypothetical protein
VYLLIDEQFDLVLTNNEAVVSLATRGEYTVVNMDTRQYFDGKEWRGIDVFSHTP